MTEFDVTTLNGGDIISATGQYYAVKFHCPDHYRVTLIVKKSVVLVKKALYAGHIVSVKGDEKFVGKIGKILSDQGNNNFLIHIPKIGTHTMKEENLTFAPQKTSEYDRLVAEEEDAKNLKNILSRMTALELYETIPQIATLMAEKGAQTVVKKDEK